MTINYETVIKEVSERASVTCDRCKTTYSDEMEIQEFLFIREQGGYGSKYWGDMRSWGVDLCEACSYELFEDFASAD